MVEVAGGGEGAASVAGAEARIDGGGRCGCVADEAVGRVVEVEREVVVLPTELFEERLKLMSQSLGQNNGRQLECETRHNGSDSGDA
jgi:hypothetical protein